MTKARDIADFKFENIVDTGTEGTKVASGTTAQRGSTTGQIRFNSTTSKAEYYDGTEFKVLEANPIVSSVTPTVIDSASGSTTNIIINGEFFVSGATVKLIANNATEITPNSITFNNTKKLTINVTDSSFNNSIEPYDVKVTLPSGQTAQLDDAISVDVAPVFTTASGSIGTINNQARYDGYYTLSPVTATDADGDTITYSIQSGSLPTGMSLNTSTGALSGEVTAVGSDTTSNFTIRATAGSKTTDRAFSITVLAPVTTTYNYTGSDISFSVPSGVQRIFADMWGGAGGGGSGESYSDSGGAGGFASGNINIFGMSTLIFQVGQGGGKTGTSGGSTGTAYPNGGANTAGRTNYNSGGGGGYTGIFNGSVSQANCLLLAGGGGGAGGHGGGTGTSGNSGSGGNGGGLFSGTNDTSGAGYAGYSGGRTSNAGDPSLNSGNGYALSAGGSGSDQGAGGSGYWGGKGGTSHGGGGAGEGFTHASLVQSATQSATGSHSGKQGSINPPQTGNSFYASGIARGNQNGTGGNGKLVIQY